jgi:hypothetical protein
MLFASFFWKKNNEIDLSDYSVQVPKPPGRFTRGLGSRTFREAEQVLFTSFSGKRSDIRAKNVY